MRFLKIAVEMQSATKENLFHYMRALSERRVHVKTVLIEHGSSGVICHFIGLEQLNTHLYVSKMPVFASILVNTVGESKQLRKKTCDSILDPGSS